MRENCDRNNICALTWLQVFFRVYIFRFNFIPRQLRSPRGILNNVFIVRENGNDDNEHLVAVGGNGPKWWRSMGSHWLA